MSQTQKKASDVFLTRHFGSPNTEAAKDFNFAMNTAILLGLRGDTLIAAFTEKFGEYSPLTNAARDVIRAHSLAKSQEEYETLLIEGTVTTFIGKPSGSVN